MPIIIDGWNLIRSDSSDIDDIEEESLDAAKAMIACLKNFQSRHNDPIILVFDSNREFLGIDHKNTAKLTVVPARDADSYIKKFIDKTPERQRRNLRVVSSDNSVYYYARSSSASPLRSEEFWDKLSRDAEALS